MPSENENEKSLLSHHVQQPLCTTRLPYRQGRKLTAVKAYTINNESVHLLIFGVPSLTLRQETKSLFCKFGKILQFNIVTKYPTETFTETYHALYDRLAAARIAKKIVDGKNFYGGILHVCYAPEMESLEELRNKLIQRKKEVYNRLKRNEEIILEIEDFATNENPTESDDKVKENEEIVNEVKEINNPIKMNMAEVNIISISKKRKKIKGMLTKKTTTKESITKEKKDMVVVDCTDVEKETVTNIYEHSEDKVEIRKMPKKSLNKIVYFNK